MASISYEVHLAVAGFLLAHHGLRHAEPCAEL